MRIFLDFDGTIIDISNRHYYVYKKIVEKLKGTPLDKNMYWRKKRNKIPLPMLIAQSGLTEDSLELFIKYFVEEIEDPKNLLLDKLFSPSIRTLEFLSANNSLHLVSFRNNKKNAIEQIKNLGLSNFFSSIDVGHLTKSVFMKKHLIAGEKFIMVGDTEDDVLSAKQLNGTSIAVLSGIRNRRNLYKLNPDLVINTIGDLKKMEYTNQHL